MKIFAKNVLENVETGLDNLIQFFENFKGDKFEIYYYGQTLQNLRKRMSGHQSHHSRSTIKLCKIPLVSVPNVAQTTVDTFFYRQFKAYISQQQQPQQQTRPIINIDFNTKLYFRLSIYNEQNGGPLCGCINYRSPNGDVVKNFKAFNLIKMNY
ncbi:hypothetical protein ACTFIY_011447 [Dictyostelium cf. discoideum]